MRSSGRSLNIVVNENALKAWLASSRPVAHPTRPPAVPSPIVVVRCDTKADKG